MFLYSNKEKITFKWIEELELSHEKTVARIVNNF